MKRLLKGSTALLGLVVLAGCAVGPDFHKPDLPKGMDYQSAPRIATAGHGGTGAGVSQTFQTGVDIPLSGGKSFKTHRSMRWSDR